MAPSSENKTMHAEPRRGHAPATPPRIFPADGRNPWGSLFPSGWNVSPERGFPSNFPFGFLEAARYAGSIDRGEFAYTFIMSSVPTRFYTECANQRARVQGHWRLCTLVAAGSKKRYSP